MPLMESAILCEDVTLGSAISPQKKKEKKVSFFFESAEHLKFCSIKVSQKVLKHSVCLLSWVQTNWIINFKCRGYHQSSVAYFVIVNRDIQNKTHWKNVVFKGIVSRRLQKIWRVAWINNLGLSCSWALSMFFCLFFLKKNSVVTMLP